MGYLDLKSILSIIKFNSGVTLPNGHISTTMDKKLRKDKMLRSNFGFMFVCNGWNVFLRFPESGIDSSYDSGVCETKLIMGIFAAKIVFSMKQYVLPCQYVSFFQSEKCVLRCSLIIGSNQFICHAKFSTHN